MVKQFDDFMKSFTQKDIDEAIESIRESAIPRQRAKNSHLSKDEQLISMSLDVSMNLSTTLLSWYHDWLHDIP